MQGSHEGKRSVAAVHSQGDARLSFSICLKVALKFNFPHQPHSDLR